MDIDAYFAEQRRREALDELRAHRNRKILAERLHWPDGALSTCERLDDEHPGWSFFWLRENTTPGFERPAGFSAQRLRPEVRLFDADPDQLANAVKLTSVDH